MHWLCASLLICYLIDLFPDMLLVMTSIDSLIVHLDSTYDLLSDGDFIYIEGDCSDLSCNTLELSPA